MTRIVRVCTESMFFTIIVAILLQQVHLYRQGTTLAHHETPIIADLSLQYMRHPSLRVGRLDVLQWPLAQRTLGVAVDQQPVTVVLRRGKELVRMPARPATGWMPPAKTTKVWWLC